MSGSRVICTVFIHINEHFSFFDIFPWSENLFTLLCVLVDNLRLDYIIYEQKTYLLDRKSTVYSPRLCDNKRFWAYGRLPVGLGQKLCREAHWSLPKHYWILLETFSTVKYLLSKMSFSILHDILVFGILWSINSFFPLVYCN